MAGRARRLWRGRFEAALACFRAAAALRPDDGPSRVFIERCTAFLRRTRTPEGWDGIWHFDLQVTGQKRADSLPLKTCTGPRAAL